MECLGVMLLVLCLLVSQCSCRPMVDPSSFSPPHLFYIYDYGLWHNISIASMNLRDDPNEILETTINNGAGPLVNITRGAYHTDQYQLFLLIYHRALKDYRRTLDPEKATTFIIPYDMASDVAYYKVCGKSAGTCFDFRKCPLAPSVESLLRESPWYQRNHGKDHLLIVGNNYAMDHYIGKPKCKAFLSGVCYNCTKMSIDDYSFLHSGDQGKVEKGDFWHAIPFPGDFHWSKNVSTPFPWENEDRPVLVSYIGSTKSYYGPARRLRGSLVHYCELHRELCVHQTYGKNGTRSSFMVEGYDPLQLSGRSVFCFQPIGDLMTRKGLFDSLLQGCIPVVFDVLTASVMYTWHWEESFWDEVVVALPFHPVAFRYSDPVATLHEMFVNRTEVVKKKLALIRSRVFELQYGLQGRHEVEGDEHHWRKKFRRHRSSHGDNSPLHSHNHNNNSSAGVHLLRAGVYSTSTWPRYSDGRPMRDAYDICIDHALGWHSGTEPDVRNATVPECWNGYLDQTLNRCMPGEDPSKKKKGG